MMPMNLSNVAILNIKCVDYYCIIIGINKSKFNVNCQFDAKKTEPR